MTYVPAPCNCEVPLACPAGGGQKGGEQREAMVGAAGEQSSVQCSRGERVLAQKGELSLPRFIPARAWAVPLVLPYLC